MIRIGLDDAGKTKAVRDYCAAHGLDRVCVISPEQLAPSFARRRVVQPDDLNEPGTFLHWPDVIEYRFYYRILQMPADRTLLVFNECLRGRERKCLENNCVRTFLHNLQHRAIFQRYPLIEQPDDVMTLLDWETNSRWFDRGYDRSMLEEVDLQVIRRPLHLERIDVQMSRRTHELYAAERVKLFEQVRNDPDKDPHIIPRSLALVTGKDKAAQANPLLRYVARNQRLRLPDVTSYREVTSQGERIALELPHNHLEMTDFLTVTEQERLPVMVADTKADTWYWDRWSAWAQRVNDAAQNLDW